MLLVGLVGTIINQALKLIFRIPRPWVIDEKFTVVGGDPVKEAASGFSFPSGHTQNVAGTFGSIYASTGKRWLKILSIVVIALVAFSRMYLGVHTPADVITSLVIAAVLVLCFYPVFKTEERMDKAMPYVAAGSILISLALLLFVFLSSSEGLDTASLENLKSGRKNASTLFGCIIALPLVYYVDKRYTKFESSASWYVQIIKFVLGLLGVLAIKAGLSTPLVLLFGNEYIARGVRYFLIVVFAGLLWPMAFKALGKIKIPALDRFGERVSSLFSKKRRVNEEEQSEA